MTAAPRCRRGLQERTLSISTPRGNERPRRKPFRAEEIIHLKDGSEAELWAVLEQEGFDGDSWKLVQWALAEYATSVLPGMILKGTIFGETKKVGRPVARPGFPIDKDTAVMLADDMVVDALEVFQRLARKGVGWKRMADEARRTTIATYFLRTCILCFSNVVRKWCRAQRRITPAGNGPGTEGEGVWDEYPVEDEDDAALVEKLLPSDPDDQQILLGKIRGFTNREIAEKTNQPTDRVDRRWRGIRRRLRPQLRPDGRRIEE
jgi:DNA-directed RNA polymerase specialized sigma24 family protein